jgi:hypothetical protein
LKLSQTSAVSCDVKNVREGANALSDRKPASTGKTSAKARPATSKARPKTPSAAKAAAVSLDGDSASKLIDRRIRDLGDWRGETLARMRALILEAVPDAIEEWKWRGVPVWSHDGIICTGETYTKVVKLTFAKGASIPDPSRLFNSSLEGNTRRAIDIHEGERIDAGTFTTLVKAAAVLNGQSKAKKTAKARHGA